MRELLGASYHVTPERVSFFGIAVNSKFPVCAHCIDQTVPILGLGH